MTLDFAASNSLQQFHFIFYIYTWHFDAKQAEKRWDYSKKKI